jgi:hypothetical protein
MAFVAIRKAGDESPAYEAASHEWDWTIQASQIHLALFSRPGIYAGAMKPSGLNRPAIHRRPKKQRPINGAG